MKNTKKSIAIIGGGAAGLMATATILESKKQFDIHIFDKNDHLGSKVIISGGGRCNLTNALDNKDLLLKKYIRGSEFLKYALSKFSPKHTYKWFEDHGVQLKIEKDLRVFPVSDDGQDVVNVFKEIFYHNKVTIHLKSPVTNITKNKDNFNIATSKESYNFDYVIITTGGNAYRHTGSSGDGYAFAQNLGHNITPLGPSLNSFITNEKWTHELSGLSFPTAQLIDKKSKNKVIGPLLFTHFGISGPATFALSSHLSFEKIENNNPLTINFIPDNTKNFQDWDNELIKATQTEKQKLFKNTLSKLLPERFVIKLLELSEISNDIKNSNLLKKDRQKIAHLLSGDLTITLLNRRPGDEFVTAGGVNTNEINNKTMESLITDNLYFSGEVMDIDAVTGGFNLQSSWATGRMAGIAISQK